MNSTDGLNEPGAQSYVGVDNLEFEVRVPVVENFLCYQQSEPYTELFRLGRLVVKNDILGVL
ncbi:hypothetical protein Atai01_26530 [Amycolatopsis taiwanensis]|uniref:Uncharacterized protein n=1 Tax=Amycolatopsis taiwanensis TaxID=342230 RepID=A0A9W6QXW3_9PSEU|nr:hypothetical protein Atai01_26530 [Amycolatopsis taiwanensis]